jgi:signal transduction histidine kinase
MDTRNILLIEDDEDDYVIIVELLSKVGDTRYHLQWIRSFDEAMDKAFNEKFDACLLDYRLGIRDGLAILKKLKEESFNGPVIMMTGQGSRVLDVDAMNLGADDYIEKASLDSNLLERSIRYGIDRWKNMQILKDSEVKLRNLSAKIMIAQEDERKYIAKELHDSIGSNLTAIKLMLETNKSSFEYGMSGGGFTFDKILSTVIETIKETQRITKRLRPEILDRLGIVASLRSIARQFSEINKNIQVDVEIDVEEQNIPDPLKIIIFRVAQEALNNISKHSEANNVKIFFGESDQRLEFIVSDNGKGFDTEGPAEPVTEKTGGIGIEGMRERVKLSNGCFEVVSKKNGGTTIRAWWMSES